MDGIKRKINESLQLRLSIWISGIIFVIALISGIFSFYSAFVEANELQDDQLQQIAALLNQKVISSELNQSNELLSALPIDSEARVYIHNLSKGSSSQLIPSLTNELPDGFQTAVTRQKIWRVFVKTLANKERVALAQDTELRNEIAIDGALRTLLPTVILIPVLIVVINILIRRTFVPIEELAHRMDQRTDHELGQVPTDGIPIELRPFVGAINRLLARVTQSVETQKRFIADAAHELRSPLTALSLQAESLDSVNLSEPNQLKIQRLKEGLLRARNLLEQLLTLARTQGHQQNVSTSVSVGEIFRRVLEDLMPLALRKQLDIGVVSEEDVTLFGNETEISTLIKNIVDNAIRYTPEGGQIDLSVGVNNEKVNIIVHDSGAGIPPEEIDRVFDPFFRVAGNQEIGSGLGLSIVKNIIEKMNGHIYLENKGILPDTSGLKVTISIPDSYLSSV